MIAHTKSSFAVLAMPLFVSTLLAAACSATSSEETTFEQGQNGTKKKPDTIAPCGDGDDDDSDAGPLVDAAATPVDAKAPEQVPDAATPPPTTGWDCDDPKGCDFIDQTGCPSGQACFLRDGSWGTQCAVPGGGRAGSSCTVHSDCDRGYMCSGKRCLGACGAGFVPKACRDDGAFGCMMVVKNKGNCNYGICSNTVSP